ncbi:YOP protein translocation protein K (YscK) [Prosthecobacter fusiformis]|uniref:YOP protein translocation protein K (YscK) n=1 Tax=Prosthecobacter fusiformis TaxID=48464 RepID=A0A4R7RXU8_9BACT|nr:SctK family type III secretion system sorting platform protein [Prosthecobacter fusiformis]TDU70700.1 YOP protein translocation protein K (YscK) [Prosthecobacter fusiformis]
MSTRGGWYASQAKTNPDLFRAIFDFNHRPQFWLHPEVIARFPEAAVIRVLATGTHGHHHLASWLTRVLQLDDYDPVWDFQESRLRIALLSPETLTRLARYTGVALCWPRIASIIGRQQLHEIKASIGEDAHAFALRRARFIVPENEAILPKQETSLIDHVMDIGWNVLASSSGDESGAIRERLALKLPLQVAKKVTWHVTPELRDQAWNRVRQISREVLTVGESKCFA